jgi:hypothetical protein
MRPTPLVSEPGATPTLAACWAKHDRAHEHCGELHDEFERYFADEPVRIESSGFDAVSGWWTFRTVEVKRLPLRPSVIVGDVVHNLRSALDHLVCQLVLFNHQTPTTGNQFPIESDRTRFSKSARRMLAGVRDDHATRIEALQPFNRTEDDELSKARAWALGLLRDLSNQDKHRLINPVTAVTTPNTEFVFGSNDDAGPIGEIVFSGRIAAGVEFARIHIAPQGPDPHVRLLTEKVSSDAFFAGSEMPVITVMRALRMTAANILLGFEPDLDGDAAAAERAEALTRLL